MKKVNFFMYFLFAAVLAGCDNNDSPEMPDDDESPSTESETAKYLVTSIERDHNSPGHTCKTIVYFEYDDQNRIVKQTAAEEGNGNSEDMYVTTFTYNESGFTMYGSYYDGSYEEYATFTTNEEGYVTAFTIEDNDGSYVGTMSYDSDNYLQQATRSSSSREYTDMAYWENGNMVKVVNDIYGVGSSDYMAEMEYDNSDYVNNPLLSIDLNWALSQSEWVGCFGFGAMYVQYFGFVGQRSRLLMTTEYDRYYTNGKYYTYSYEFDDLNRPIKVVVLEDGNTDDVQTYTITYMAD